MLFHTFSSQKERREFGRSYFIELQYCRLPPGTPLEQIVSVDAIEHWKNDSLYIYGDDDNAFVRHYGEIFTGGTYNNLTCGSVDMTGINYYTPEQSRLILTRITEKAPPEYALLRDWLENGSAYSGFYLLGL